MSSCGFSKLEERRGIPCSVQSEEAKNEVALLVLRIFKDTVRSGGLGRLYTLRQLPEWISFELQYVIPVEQTTTLGKSSPANSETYARDQVSSLRLSLSGSFETTEVSEP